LPVSWDAAFLAQNARLPMLPQGSGTAGMGKGSLSVWWDVVIHADGRVLPLVPTTAILTL